MQSDMQCIQWCDILTGSLEDGGCKPVDTKRNLAGTLFHVRMVYLINYNQKKCRPYTQ